MITLIVNSFGPPGGPYESGGSIRNPLFFTKTKNEAEFFLVGVDESRLEKSGQSGHISFESAGLADLKYKDGVPAKPNLGVNQIQTQFEAWYADTKKIVDARRAQVLQPDVLRTLDGAFAETQEYGRSVASKDRKIQDKISPYGSLLVVIRYLHRVGIVSLSPEHIGSPWKDS
jgi:hypothetical protein